MTGFKLYARSKKESHACQRLFFKHGILWSSSGYDIQSSHTIYFNVDLMVLYSFVVENSKYMPIQFDELVEILNNP